MTGSAKRLGDRLLGGAMIAMLVLVLAFLVTPLLVTCLLAFDARSFLGPLPPPALSMRWFEKLVSLDYVTTGLATSLKIAVLTTAVDVLVGTAAAVALDRSNFPGRSLLMAAFLSPLIVPAVVIGFALLLFLSRIGIVDGFTRLLCGHIVITLPYVVRTVLASLTGRDRRLTEAALVLGATERQAFWNITLPLIRSGMITGAVFAFAVSLDDVAVSMFLTDPSTYTLPVALVSNMRASFDLTIAAAAVLLMAVSAVLIIVLERFVGFDRLLGQGLFRS
ncbi:ABC transporter permease [Bosea sp. BIWAKO-01]|uniref:ABC transporter permease n=1 Tax=Bosea sp. BIWAKO-01 TaxID=506668 RepID=UPI000852B718|nr:ABC transporter permease [Bosea sp. BIWAKO-01]GAU85094.1 spermidine putrescine ABC transporter permease component potC [Bosea sp. BIWAKO-01]